MKAILLIPATVLILSGGAIAQRFPAGGTGTPSPSKVTDNLKQGVRPGAKDTRRVVQEFARCVVKAGAPLVSKFLDAPDVKWSSGLRGRAADCLGDSAGDDSRLQGAPDTFRFALAEAWLIHKFHDTGMSDLSAIAPLAHPGEIGPNAAHALGTMSECIIRKSPAESWALLRTDAASAEEKTRFAALGPAMQACVTRGTTVKMQAFFMRGAIAQTYYRLSQAPRASAGSVN